MSFYGIVEYKAATVVWALGAAHFPRINDNVDLNRCPKRGWPPGDPTLAWSGATKEKFAALVVKGSTEDNRESDGLCITEDTARNYLSLGSEWLEDDDHGQYRRISLPDTHSVNWVKRSELKEVVEAARLQNPIGWFGQWDATLASMKALKAAPEVEWVRFVYGWA